MTDGKRVTAAKEDTSADIYFSEDALENAKVVEREARPTNRKGSGRTTPNPRAAAASSRVIPRSTANSTVPRASVSTAAAEDISRSQAATREVDSSHANKASSAGARRETASTGVNSNPAVRDHTQARANRTAAQTAAVTERPSAAAEAKVEPKPSKGSIVEVELDKIQPNPDQPRTNFKPEEIEELASSIKKEGLLQPILVRKVADHYQIIAGERRYQAAKSLGLKAIPVRLWMADKDKALELALIENIQRTDLNPIEEAYGYKRLMERRGMTQSEIAQAVSKGRSTIANALRLLDLPEEAQQLLFEEKITAGHARAILSVPTPEGRKTLTNKLMEENLSVRETEAIARLMAGRATQEETPSKRVPTPASFKKAARGLSRVLGTSVRVKTVQGKSKIEIQFQDEEDLERIFNAIVHHEEA